MVSKYRVTNCQGNILIYKQVNVSKLYQKISKKTKLCFSFLSQEITHQTIKMMWFMKSTGQQIIQNLFIMEKSNQKTFL